MSRRQGKYENWYEAEQSEVKSFNLFDLSWDEIQAKGLDKHVDKETYEKYHEETE